MSLNTLPISVSDLTQLQLGIEFFSNPAEATTEAGLITTPPNSVYSYAVQLLGNNISLSQVAMAVDSLMFGTTDNTTELTKLATQFLPAQAAAAVAAGLNPTVYAAETLGLALAGGRGDTLSTSHFPPSFATLFGSLPVAQFVSDVASLTGINATAIQGFVQSWTNFYSANPSATFGLPLTLAAYGTAFGDAVGVALLNPAANGTTALLVNEEQNALIDNAEGLYRAGIPLVSEPPHIPLQGEAVLIPGGGGLRTIIDIDWAAQFAADNYAQLVDPALSGSLTILNAPSTFTLNTQHFTTHDVTVEASGHYGNLCTLILGDSTAAENVGQVSIDGYQTVHIVANGDAQESVTPLVDITPPVGSNAHLVVSGSGFPLSLGDISNSAHEGKVSVALDGGTITDVGVPLYLGVTDAETIDASNAPLLAMQSPALVGVGGSGVIVIGGDSNNLLQGSLGTVSTVFFTNVTTGVSAGIVGDDNITGGAGGEDLILGDGGADNIILSPSHLPETVGFGYNLVLGAGQHVLAITDGFDVAYPGFWGATVSTAIPNLFPNSSTGGTSADMTTITGFHAGSSGDRLFFETAAWNGASIDGLGNPAASGDLVNLGGTVVTSAGDAHLSTAWANSSSNISLNASDDVLLYAPAGGSPDNAQELAAQLHGASGAIVLPGFILPHQDEHILVAYDANSTGLPVAEIANAASGFSSPLHGPPPVVHIADVDLVNTTDIPQSATFNLHVYASDMVSLVGVSLTSLTTDNIHFI